MVTIEQIKRSLGRALDFLYASGTTRDMLTSNPIPGKYLCAGVKRGYSINDETLGMC
jgi:hypothetical protein